MTKEKKEAGKKYYEVIKNSLGNKSKSARKSRRSACLEYKSTLKKIKDGIDVSSTKYRG